MKKVIICGTLLILAQTFLAGVDSASTKDFKCSGGAEVTFNGNTFIGLKKQIINSEIDISVDVTTTTRKDGLILWKRSEESGDHISLGLVHGFVVFEYFYGREERKVKIRSNTKVNDGHKHVVNAIKKSGGGGSIAVGFAGPVETPAITSDKLDTSEGVLYLGGLPPTMDVNKTTFGSYAAPFTGCISSLVVSYSVDGTPTKVSSAEKEDFYSRTSGFLVDGGNGVTCEERCPFTAEKLNASSASACARISKGLVAIVASLIVTFHRY